ncbi:hypothetical protein TcCL_ESM10274 [Trypanosoma cruzi]|nr:hypothetical protein TcCL_ESM10274 [Trypanosoma cruzi]
MLSLSTHTHTIDQAAVTLSTQKSTSTATASASPDTCPGLPAAVTHTDEQQQHKSARTITAHTTRRRTVTIAIIELIAIAVITRNGVAGARQLIGEAEEKECN